MPLSKIPEVARFAIAGIINLGIDLTVFSVALYVFELHLLLANTIAYSIATMNSYVLNKFWTFAGRSAPTMSTAEFSRFVAFNLGGLLLSNIAVSALARYIPPIVAKLCAVGVTFVWNYLTIRRFVFTGDQAKGTEHNEV